MSNVVEGLKGGRDSIKNFDDIQNGNDPELQALLHTYAEAEGKDDDLIDILKTAPNKRAEPQRQDLRKMTKEFSERLRKAEAVIGTIKQRGLESVLEGSAPDIPEGGLTLYIKGIGVREPTKLAELHKKLTAVEVSAFKGKTEKRLAGVIEQMQELAGGHIDSGRMKDLLLEENNADRLAQIRAAMAGEDPSNWQRFKTAVQGEFGMRDTAGRINGLMKEYRAIIKKEGINVEDFAKQLSGTSTSADFFGEVSDILQAKRERGPDKKLGLGDLQKMTKPESILDAFEKRIADKHGGTAGLNAYKNHIRNNRGADLTTFKALTLPDGTTIGDVYDEAGKDIEDNIKSRGIFSSLIRVLWSAMSGTTIKDNKDNVLGLARNKY